MLALVDEVVAFVGVGLQVVEFVGAVGEAGDEFPVVSADGPGGFVFEEDCVVPVGFGFAVEGVDVGAAEGNADILCRLKLDLVYMFTICYNHVRCIAAFAL